MDVNTKSPSIDRIESLDALRDAAVLGIFVFNILGFGLGEVAFSNPILTGGIVWWMTRFSFGPFEWVWRSLTYGKNPASS